ncbi:dTDP-4-dehydrorhamnose 3,5-epimerase [Jiulongibacter sediminis]|uniref:dTDP-4-dehydrorhamnose 3,5-epimerase n=1 Tax=Jiulongibacter sediminis TaxID=1605367 RepID=A0A0P7B981_9BACT|nr:dTDP-4-dehydrorhamnose 3,5-epimerase [Jiulongibacter sediminis]KPM46903.1 dTDP-4-dehydrorhamnose 3,5-epimerase [Jiulongibacter sediminis]TBX22252.1 dTDP-4-dehydrorhamnose 3,5-epimerase [Jiulongibacter sediminis]
MEFRKTSIEGLIEIKPRIFKDPRGYFFESYQYELFKQNGIAEVFVQDNQSYSTKGVLRGLHLQKDPFAQGKLVRVIKGKVLDVAVDARPGSPTFGQWDSVVLDDEQNNMFYVPPGFLHGFVTLEDAIFSYKCTNYYNRESEQGVIWNDSDLNIDWGIENPLVSEKDMALPRFSEISF